MSWIPIREALPDDARVLSIADRLDIHPAHALGLCVTFWALASQQTADGRLERWTTGMIDRKLGQPGFAEALIEVEWLERPAVSPPGFGSDVPTLVIPRWDRYMSNSAKARALAARRQAVKRSRGDAPDDQADAHDAQDDFPAQPTATDSPTPTRRRARRGELVGPRAFTPRGAEAPASTPRDGERTASTAPRTPVSRNSVTDVTVERDARHAAALPREEKRREEESGGGAFARTTAPVSTPPPEPGAPPPPLVAARGGVELPEQGEAWVKRGKVALAENSLVAEGFTPDDAAALVCQHGADAVGLGLAVARHKRDHPAPGARPIANWRGLIWRAVTERWPAPIAMGGPSKPERPKAPTAQEAARAAERAALAWWSAMGQDEREAAQARAAATCEPATRARVTRETPHVGNVALAVLLHRLLAERDGAREAVGS